MSLLSTLAKVAVGVAVAKGVSSMSANKSSSRTPSRKSGTGSVFGSSTSSGGSLTDILTGGAGGGLADLLAGGTKNAGGLGTILSGKGTSGGGLGGLLEGLSQASRPGAKIPVQRPSSGSLGDLLNQSLDNFGEPETQPSRQQEEAAGVMLRAMLQAAKSDGRIDADEKSNLLEKLGDVSAEEMAFINAELKKPVDVDGLARDVPRGMGAQVYTMSLMAIDLDSQNEAKYLHELAQALGIDAEQSNEIHARMGEPNLYS